LFAHLSRTSSADCAQAGSAVADAKGPAANEAGAGDITDILGTVHKKKDTGELPMGTPIKLAMLNPHSALPLMKLTPGYKESHVSVETDVKYGGICGFMMTEQKVSLDNLVMSKAAFVASKKQQPKGVISESTKLYISLSKGRSVMRYIDPKVNSESRTKYEESNGELGWIKAYAGLDTVTW
jgi:hypothetical protein